MNRTKRLVSLLAIVAVLMLLPNAGGVAAQQGGPVSGQGTLVGTAFTYQGLLKASGAPISSTCTLNFSLWDAPTLGTQVGTTQTVTPTVSGGYFTVSLDFGPVFDGNQRWLAIQVQCTGDSSPTLLTPRQPLTAAPYALYAVNAGTATSANTAVSATTAANFSGMLAGDVSGLQGSTTVTGLLGRPVADAKPDAGQVLTFDGSQWAPATPSGGGGVTDVSASAPLSSTGGTTPIISFTGVLPLANGGTGSASQNFVDLTNAQVVGGAKTYSSAPSFDASVGVPFSVTLRSLVANLNADRLDSHHASDFQQHYQNVVVVAKSGGDFTTIGAALASITPTASATNPYLIYVAPGVYTETVFMWPYVDIEGAGELATKITQPGSTSQYTGTVVGANNAELRFLTVENTGGSYLYAVAIYNNSAAPRLTHITATASGGTGSTNYGVYNENYSSPTMTNVTASASGGSAAGNRGVYNYNLSSPTMTNVTASASGGLYNYGVFNDTSSPTMTNVSTTASGGTSSTNYGVYNQSSSPTMTNVTASASGGTHNYGVYNQGSSPTMTNVTTSAWGGYNYGVYNITSSPTIQNSVISASGGTSYGIYNGASNSAYILTVDASQITGNATISQTAHCTTLIGASKLVGGGVGGSGTYTCTASYNSSYGALGNDCQSIHQNRLVVAKSGGDFTTITAALASITPTASATNPYLIYVAPGVYTETVFMWPYVDIEGAGELATKITHAGSACGSHTMGTVVGANNAELRFLTVENTGGANCATAIYNNSAAPRLTHITATASGGTENYGVDNVNSSPAMTVVIATASGGTDGYGVFNSASAPKMTNVTASASGGSNNYGVFNDSSSSPTMTSVMLNASGGAYNYGVFNFASSPTIQNSVISASDGTSYGIYNLAGGDVYTVTVDASQIAGSTTISQTYSYTTLIGASKLAGGSVGGHGTYTCAVSYSSSYVELGNNCK